MEICTGNFHGEETVGTYFEKQLKKKIKQSYSWKKYIKIQILIT